MVVSYFFYDLRRHVMRTAQNLRELGLMLEWLSKTEVYNFDEESGALNLLYHDVLRLDVPVRNLLTMQELEEAEQLSRNILHIVFFHRAHAVLPPEDDVV